MLAGNVLPQNILETSPQENFLFDCECLACEEGWQTYTHLPSDTPSQQVSDKLCEYEMDNMTALERGELDKALAFHCKELALIQVACSSIPSITIIDLSSSIPSFNLSTSISSITSSPSTPSIISNTSKPSTTTQNNLSEPHQLIENIKKSFELVWWQKVRMMVAMLFGAVVI